MKFLNKLTKLGFINQSKEKFADIEGYSDIKEIVNRALTAEDNINILFHGAPASAKTLFLRGIGGEYFDASNTTNRILDILESKRPKVVCLDELDKMPKRFQEQLLGFLQDGKVDVEQQKKQYHFEIKGCKVFATCNELKRISRPLQSRFRILSLPRYTEEQFINISVKVLKNLSDPLARYIAHTVFKQGGDIRTVQSVGKLLRREDGPEDADRIINTLTQYSVGKGEGE
jgi:MoxR-like ATPase